MLGGGGHCTAAQSQSQSHNEHSLRGPLYDHLSPPHKLTAAPSRLGTNYLRGPLNAHGWGGTKPKSCWAQPAGAASGKEPRGLEVVAVTSARDIQKKWGEVPFLSSGYLSLWSKGRLDVSF